MESKHMERLVCKKGLMFKGVWFSSKELLSHVGKRVVVDDLGIQNTPEILVKTVDGEFLCLAEKSNHLHNPFHPLAMGSFERALRKINLQQSKAL